MSIDYDAVFGIGYEVSLAEGYEDESMDDFESFLDWKFEDIPEIYSASFGNSYSGNFEYIITINVDFLGSDTLDTYKKRLDEALIDVKEVSIDSPFGLVGGVSIY